MKYKYFLLPLFVGMACTNVFSQPVIKWQKTIGGGIDDRVTTAYKTNDGGYMLAGYSSSNRSGEKTENNRDSVRLNGDDFWLVKLDHMGNIQWDKTIGTKADEGQFSLQNTRDNGFILGCSSQKDKSGDKTDTSRGEEDYWVIKLNSDGKIQWDKTIGGRSNDNFSSLRQTADGGYIVAGWTGSPISGDKTSPLKGGADYWIVKLDSIGNIQWDKDMGGNLNDELVAVELTPDGGFITAGFSNSKRSGDKTENSRGDNDYWIVKLDKTGNVQWDKTIGGDKSDYLDAIHLIGDGGFILSGHSYSGISGEKTEIHLGGANAADEWLVKLDKSGNIQWDKTVGTADDDALSLAPQLSDKGYILWGFSASNKSGDKTENSRGGSDYWVIKLNSTGAIEWDKTIGGNAEERLTSLQQTYDGGYVMAGPSESGISGDKTENSRGLDDYWVVKLKSTGAIEWDKTIGGDNADGVVGAFPVLVDETAKNSYLVSGSSYSGISGDKTDTSRGGWDYWIVLLNVKKTATATTGEQKNISPDTDITSMPLVAYPNPAKHTVTISYTAQKKGKYIFEIAGINGNVLLHKEAYAMQGTNSIKLDVNNLFKGVYFINIIKPDNTRERIQLSKE